MTIHYRRLPDDVDRRCDGCHRTWPDLMRLGPWDDREFVELRGLIGAWWVFAVLCPACVDDLRDTLSRAAGWTAKQIADDAEWNQDDARGRWLAAQPEPDLPPGTSRVPDLRVLE